MLLKNASQEALREEKARKPITARSSLFEPAFKKTYSFF